MRSSTTSSNKTPDTNYTYSPSVPLSVYRELAAELQAAEALLDSLNAQNQHLAKHNQKLRQEIEKAVQSVLYLQQVVDSAAAVSWTYADYPTRDFNRKPTRPVSEPERPMYGTGSPSGVRVNSGFSEKVFTQQEGRYRCRSQPKSASDISGWWLAIAMLLIILTAFGAGYLIVRPVLQSR